jgi:hypothetical protein
VQCHLLSGALIPRWARANDSDMCTHALTHTHSVHAWRAWSWHAGLWAQVRYCIAERGCRGHWCALVVLACWPDPIECNRDSLQRAGGLCRGLS